MNLFASLLLVAYNYCTLSYTMADWGKAEWTPELDRLEQNGFNVALVTAGLPKVWQLTLEELGYPPERIAAFIPDRAAAAWWNMGNLEGLGGPVAQADIEADAELGRWLCAEMRRRHIEPILQGFAGLVPSGTAGAVEQGCWCNIYVRPAILDPESENFDRFARVWYRNLEKVYGIKPKYLGGDLFHEGGDAKAFAGEAITAAARKVQRLQQEAFPGVTWVLQSWQNSPRAEIRRGLDPRFTLIEILDKDMSSHGDYDYRFAPLPWVWCEVMNFGGNTGLYGGAERFKTLSQIAEGRGGEYFRGYGMLSEGLDTNDYCYYLFLRNANGREWSVKEYVKLRYGVEDERLELAIRRLEASVWDCRLRQEGCIENVMCAYPAFEVRNVSAWGPRTGVWYDRAQVREAARLYLAADMDGDNYRNDLVEVLMQLLADKARAVLPETRFDLERRREFLDLIVLADALAAFSDNWRLDKKARSAGYLRMITTWAASEDEALESGLGDYAHRAYHGLLVPYYLERWERVFGMTADRRQFDGLDLKATAAKILEKTR